MRQRERLVDRSLAILRDGQAASGAFLACPTFPTYRYCWFRDGTFIAHALDLWGEHAMARRFYDWGAGVVLRYASDVEAALSSPAHQPPPAFLHTRYHLDGSRGDAEWPNFQLDGFGTFLWGMAEHLDLVAATEVPEHWRQAAHLLVLYLEHLWQAPSYDCWEEFPDKVHLSTLAAIHAGLAGSARRIGTPVAATGAIKDFVLAQASGGALPKYVGSNAVDASLLWVAVPFGLLAVESPTMARTMERIERELIGPHGGVHRYADDSYYGGGAWILLTAGLAECWAARGNTERARELCRWVETQADARGRLPEQVAVDLPHPEQYQPWVDAWGAIASPLLWSHASYLRLIYRLRVSQRAEEAAS